MVARIVDVEDRCVCFEVGGRCSTGLFGKEAYDQGGFLVIGFRSTELSLLGPGGIGHMERLDELESEMMRRKVIQVVNGVLCEAQQMRRFGFKETGRLERDAQREDWPAGLEEVGGQ